MEGKSTCSNDDLICIADELLARWERADKAVVFQDNAEDWDDQADGE